MRQVWHATWMYGASRVIWEGRGELATMHTYALTCIHPNNRVKVKVGVGEERVESIDNSLPPCHIGWVGCEMQKELVIGSKEITRQRVAGKQSWKTFMHRVDPRGQTQFYNNQNHNFFFFCMYQNLGSFMCVCMSMCVMLYTICECVGHV